jgi:hypothetical protein
MLQNVDCIWYFNRPSKSDVRSPTAMDGGSADHAGAVICRHAGEYD